MVFITGPRQVGKTWLARHVAEHFEQPIYLNYDDFDDRRTIESRSWYRKADLLIFDELRKMKNWKNFIKGVYDKYGEQIKIIVTGSARLDTFRRSGDSLSGRYYLHRLLPFSFREIQPRIQLEQLYERGGFPEPLLAESSIDANRWRNQYKDSLVRQEIADLGRVADLRNMELLFELLRRRVGSPVSYQSIARDMHVSAPTVKNYVDILESLFVVFRVSPYSRNIARAIQKSPKLYFFDPGFVIGDEGARFENLVAVSLLKHLWAQNDYNGREMTLRYIRTKEGREVDFCLCEQDTATELIEVKWRDTALDKNLKFFASQSGLSAIQVVYDFDTPKTIDAIDVVPAEQFLSRLEM